MGSKYSIPSKILNKQLIESRERKINVVAAQILSGDRTCGM